MEPEYAALAAVQDQLAFVGAVLGGFAVTLLVGLLQLDERRAIVRWTAGAAAVAAAALLFVTVVSVVGAFQLIDRPDAIAPGGRPGPELTAAVRWSARAFGAGTLALLTALGLGGWIRSRWLGLTTSAAAALAGGLALLVLRALERA